MAEYYADPYVKNCTRIFPEQGRYSYHRYDMNENPEGLPEDFVKSVLKEITPEFLATYPEPLPGYVMQQPSDVPFFGLCRGVKTQRKSHGQTLLCRLKI